MLNAVYSGAEAALAEELRAAHDEGAPVEIVGGGTRRALGQPVQAARALSTSALSGISLYEPGALTLVVGAGTPLADVEAALEAEGQRLPFEPMDHRGLLGSAGEPTIGGVAAINNSGPRRVQAGACRDAMLGVRFVDGRGEVIRNGGRVMKNVTGYDLVKLMAGSWGVLGVLTEIAFKVLPAPEAAATIVIEGLDDAAGVAALSAALGSPWDVNGAAHGAGRTLIRVEGFEKQIAHRAPALVDALKAHGTGEIVTGAASDALWRGVRDVEAFQGREGAVWRLSVKPSDAPPLVASLRAKGDFEAVYDWGGGLVWLFTPEAGDAGAGAIRAETRARGGHATLVRAGASTRAAVDVFEPAPAAIGALEARLRAAFDPKSILNPGRMRG
ncbi:glycolate oxidase subunit GlcE [Pikeienuella piscinae]|uniref:Glycolate oxidase subunit GlcE n=1 Tax=Pikeienuella piscinae TaxID=2748098 RepID=A0A7M3T6A3_9RHOB|nr:glycolate oxidase subunit GlcE [Pikeienuella piscinae]QIE57534.1 glycolate oxidase subunit GlcE [Pikeienuella piscinae]